ncbi:hypothetical protein L1F30_09895 [Simiduia sp. 21SJ11W-1]|uniref:hypothetical protein n=1 Tax=Simiduia sp. 21SJ11W-1 TaxID=2909669 RepID=UPI00209DB094|nr:hypothetical protein [Simiduia sp. 21SJ11W-1]UTA46486.1 hypothetical protein L1F30_09895 [Simiduia sp. 21SJ11W-1]
MILRLLPLLLLGLALYWVYRRLGALPAPERKTWILRILAGGFLLLVLVALLTGRLNWVGALIMGIVPFVSGLWRWVSRAMTLSQYWRSFKNQSQAHPLKTNSLHLNDDATDGKILAGQFAGQSLGNLDAEALAQCLNDFEHSDPKAAKLLRLHLLKRFGGQWQGAPLHGDNEALGITEARALLGVGSDADKATIIAAHRKLIQKFHPDRGGNDYLAARINQAKDLLIKQLDEPH